MKELKDTIASAVAAASADTVNAEGAPAWTMRDADRLVQLAMTGTMGNAFYASAQEVTADAVRLLERAEPRALADAIVRGRNEGFVRAFPLLGLVYLSLKDPALFRETFPKVVLTGGDLGDFVDLARKVRGLGRGVKAAMAAWLAGKTTPYYAQKYRAQLADAVRLCRFRGEDPVFAWILASRDGAKGVTPERIAAAEAAHPALAARRDFIRAVESGDEEAALRLLRSEALDLDSLSNWNDRFTPSMWRAAARRMPAMRFLKSLGKLLRENALEEKTFREKISVERLRAGQSLMGLVEPAGDGFIVLDIEPEPGRLNVNLLARDDWETILGNAGVPEEYFDYIVDPILDWTDSDEEPNSEGAETEDYYSQLDPPYEAKNGPFDTVRELLLVKGFTETLLTGGLFDPATVRGDTDVKSSRLSFNRFSETNAIVVAGIESLLTTYGDGKINIQSAPYDVLRTLPGVDDILARAILEEREATDENGDPDPFRSADDLFARVDGLDPAIRSRITVNSQYYRITATGRSGDVERRIWCIAYAEGASLRFLRWVEEP